MGMDMVFIERVTKLGLEEIEVPIK